ncbi:SAM-dependent methyltransferase [Dethiosulfatarculus sandiegensis]|uniref:SAM-dependent methyltransferase n=2 Tax=Dethiosulfatarculus sandiegensis TaxID=1429043 RepID=A0A0D2GMB1_9BACT|nr:SAM-dependent methyltransferase [Dethiosulfatarculus sandiegensis]
MPAMSKKTADSNRVLSLANGYWASCALHAAVRLGIMPRLADSPADKEELCRELGLDDRGAAILLTALLNLKLIVLEQDSYSLPEELREFFIPGGEKDLSQVVLHMADLVSVWARLDQAVKTGSPLSRQKNAAHDKPGREHFYKAMAALAQRNAPGLAAGLGLRPGQMLLDLAGGPGIYALTFCREVPGLKARVYDLPQAGIFFKEQVAALDAPLPVEFEPGDFKKNDLGGPYDVVWLSHALHGASFEECRALVTKIAQALKPGGVLWVQDFAADPLGKGHPHNALFGLNMLVNTKGGKAYSASEILGFMEKAGFEQREYVGPAGGEKENPNLLFKGVKP